MTNVHNSLTKVEAFLSALNEQSFFKDESTPGSVLWYIDFYKKRAPQRRRAFRAGGFILLFLSISLPFLTQLAPKDLQAQVASTLAGLLPLLLRLILFSIGKKPGKATSRHNLHCSLR
jgi:hypothetical protein